MDILNTEKLFQDKFGNDFIFHPKFYEEFTDLVYKTGKEQEIIKQLISRMSSIVEMGNGNYYPNWVEHLKGYSDLYSLHITAKQTNFRILFSITNDGKIFLRMFYERAGKKATAYDDNIQIALKRKSGFNSGGM